MTALSLFFTGVAMSGLGAWLAARTWRKDRDRETLAVCGATIGIGLVVILAAAIAAVTDAHAQQRSPTLRNAVFLDGQAVGTWTSLDYVTDTRVVHITTREEVYGCKQSLIFGDRFEVGND